MLVTTTRAMVLLLALACASGCGDARDPTGTTIGAPAAKRGSGERRHDPAPLTRRFPALGRPTAVTWYSGTLGDARTPGPSSYWIDLVAELSPATTAALVAAHAPGRAAGAPDVVDALRPDVPTGTLRRSAKLDAAFSTAGFSGRVWIDPIARRLVLTARGQG